MEKFKIFLVGFISTILISTGMGIYYFSLNETDVELTAKTLKSDSKNSELENLINDYLKENNLSEEDISIYVNSFETNEEYSFNEDKYFVAASVYKLPLAMIYYEMLDSGEISNTDTIEFLDSHLESGGYIESNYALGSNISIEELLYSLIVYSDNSAGRMLFDNLGGWDAFKSISTKYSDMEYDDIFYSSDNYLNANYMNDVLGVLYNSNSFELLLEHLQLAMPDNYLNLEISNLMAQKYGMYNTALNSAGISMLESSYSIVIFTNLGMSGEVVISDINLICYNYFNN